MQSSVRVLHKPARNLLIIPQVPNQSDHSTFTPEIFAHVTNAIRFAIDSPISARVS